MKPTEEQLRRLRKHQGDPEAYHAVYDDLLEERLRELDPEWMEAMENEYGDSGMARYYA